MRSYGFDVSAYQYSNLTRYVRAGGKYVFIKLTEGTGYFNPVAAAQVKSAHRNHIYVHAYHFANFGSSVHQAKLEAKHFIARAKYLGISKKRYLALDWETGDGNIVTGPKSQNTKAIIAFMNEIKNAGYKAMLYSGASLLRYNINTHAVVSKFGTCLWVASYPTMRPVITANFNYFPSMEGVAVWQFSSNWCGLNVDGNVSVVNLHKNTPTKKRAAKPVTKPVEKTPVLVYAPVINHNSSYMISLRDGSGHATGKYIPTDSRWKVFAEKKINGVKYYKLGTDKQWVPAKFLVVIKYNCIF